MKQIWLKTVAPIALLFSFRMLGLFMLIPVFTVYANHLHSASPALIGIALGSYGLSQGLLQIPFGMLSDRLGRKPVIAGGLILFIAGSLWGAVTQSIYGMILARILQGMGAVGSVLIALLADLTPDEARTKAMAAIGATIGLSFIFSMVLSPLLAHRFGLSGIFYLSGFLGITGIALLYGCIPTPKREPFHPDTEANPVLFKTVVKDEDLLRLDFSIFCQHFILTATFYVLPILLHAQMKQGNLAQSWHFYVPVMIISFFIMLPLIVLAERKRQTKRIFISSIVVTAVSQLALAFGHQSLTAIFITAFIYFICFNYLEASLPSLVSKQAQPHVKGTALGIYSSCQFLGIFAGGSAAGLLYHYAGLSAVLLVNSLLACMWLIIACFMKLTIYRSTLLIHYPDPLGMPNKALLTGLKNLPGIIRIDSSQEEKLIYLQVDHALYQPGSAERYLKSLR
ncbi:MFS transporter [Legionella londiniensis]|uniref:Transporter, major facilitator family n=1 Tax=Legionella londiniensis TaxID=45068 RepID=A0A0W0VT83_9GAMM|nr:MFS transporter [Legionella londiniensis]KTD23304.1 transporter, major facilitator family [Legionella londiniensis]STX94141.1 transporter, major facilitator family [Legionella londiniensis]